MPIALQRPFVRSLLSALLFLAALPMASGQPQSGRPGNFDYYLFTLSWSPEYCHSHREAVECAGGNHYGFIVHGLWPQFFNGRYPERCSTDNVPDNPSSVSGIMPDPSLIRHEWQTHGTCSGLSPNQYFGLIRQTFDSIRIPTAFVNPTRSFTMRPSDVKQAFRQANPKIGDSSIAVSCPQNYLTGVQICVAKNGTPISCPPNAARDCRAGSIRIPPVR
jgi:ribonuclease T2